MPVALSAVTSRRRLASEARQRRVRQRALTFGIILTPVLLALVYLLFLAAPRYEAESRFSIQAGQTGNSGAGGGASAMTSLLSAGSGSNTQASFVGGWMVQDFLNSRDCMRQLDQKIGLRRYLAKPFWDPLSSLSPHANEDELFRSYQRIVTSSFNMIEQVNVLKVAAYSPHDSEVISRALLLIAQNFVNQMNQRGLDDAIKVSRDNVVKAEQQDRDALRALARWRDRHDNFDPAANASMMLTQVGTVESDLSTAKLTVDKLKALGNPQHPMLLSAEGQVQALEKRENELRAAMVASGGNAADLKTYGELVNAQTFADSNVMAARQGYQQAFSSALALQRYLAMVAQPISELRPSKPNVFLTLLAAFAFGCVLSGLYALTSAVYRSLRNA